MAEPVVVAASGGVPVVDATPLTGTPASNRATAGSPVTPVESGARPVTLAARGASVVFISADGGTYYPGGVLSGILLSAQTLAENSADGTAVGTLSVTGGTGTYTFTLTDSAGTRFKVAGVNGVNLQAGATNSDYETATSYNITVHADNGAGSTFDRTFPIAITDVAEGGSSYVLREDSSYVLREDGSRIERENF